MDKNNEQKNNKTPEMKPKQDSFRPWLKLIPAAAVFAAVCVTCYQADKSPVETTSVSNNNVMSTDEIKELISQGTAGKDFDSEDSSETNGTSISKTSKKTKKTSKIKTGTKKNSSTGSSANGGTAGGGAGSTVTPTTEVPAGGYADGTYTGSGTGFGGTITVQVTVTDHKIAAINIVDASNETASYFANAQGVISKILASQSPNVDAVSGATILQTELLLRFRMHCHRQFHQEIRQLLRQLPLHHRNRQRNLLQYRSRETNRFTKTEPIQEPVKDTVGQLR